MLEIIKKLIRVGKREIRNLYIREIREKSEFEDKIVEYNGVKVKPFKKIDKLIKIDVPPNQGGHKHPEIYEKALISGVKSMTEKGDRVVIVGGGMGVSTVVASRCAGEKGKVISYEASKNMVEMMEITIENNHTPSSIDVRHAYVASIVRTDGKVGEAEFVDPKNIPCCDTLVMDCKGAEKEILINIGKKPKKLVVETHGNKESILDIISENYKVVSTEPAEGRTMKNDCISRGIYVIEAELKQ